MISNKQQHTIPCVLSSYCSHRTLQLQGHGCYHYSSFFSFVVMSKRQIAKTHIFQLSPWITCYVSKSENTYIQLEIVIIILNMLQSVTKLQKFHSSVGDTLIYCPFYSILLVSYLKRKLWSNSITLDWNFCCEI